MKRCDFLVGLLLTAVCRADAREHGKPNRVAFVAPLHPADISETGDGGPLFKELRRLGYVVGQNLIVDWYTGEGRVERYGELARDVVRLKPDLDFAITTAIPQNLKAATATIPLVGIVVDPIGFGLVNNLARPGGNFTGVSVDAGIEIWGKRLELLKGRRCVETSVFEVRLRARRRLLDGAAPSARVRAESCRPNRPDPT